jgi:Histidine kinase-, DNA gyrase B-, and HSP90-like ATPase
MSTDTEKTPARRRRRPRGGTPFLLALGPAWGYVPAADRKVDRAVTGSASSEQLRPHAACCCPDVAACCQFRRDLAIGQPSECSCLCRRFGQGHDAGRLCRGLAGNKKLNFKLEVPSDLPTARGDERRISQVLLNLVGNAIKFTDTGEVAMKAAAANGSYTVAVTDTGPGIAEADRAKIFEEFQQLESTHTKAKGGTGLGLSIAKPIAEMHGGRLWVESTLGSGSTFFSSLFRCVLNNRQVKQCMADD